MAFTGYAEDLEAINRYILSFDMSSKPPITAQAQFCKDSWIKWFGTLTWSDLNLVKTNWYEGRKRRDEFNIAMGYNLPSNSSTSEVMFPNGQPGSIFADIYSGGGSLGQSIIKSSNYLLLGVGIAGGLYLLSYTRK
jgi:hypothetical protein